MRNLFKSKAIPSGETKDITVLSVHYRVEWIRTDGEYGGCYAKKPMAMFFTNLTDAQSFKKALEDAIALLQDDRHNVTLKEEKN